MRILRDLSTALKQNTGQQSELPQRPLLFFSKAIVSRSKCINTTVVEADVSEREGENPERLTGTTKTTKKKTDAPDSG